MHFPHLTWQAKRTDQEAACVVREEYGQAQNPHAQLHAAGVGGEPHCHVGQACLVEIAEDIQ